MKLNREALLQKLQSISPGLSTKDVIEQSSTYVFKDGRIITFNDEVSCSIDSPIEDAECSVPSKPLLSILEKLKNEEVTVEVTDEYFCVKGKNNRTRIRMDMEILLPIEAVEPPDKWKKLPSDFCEAVGLVQTCTGDDASDFKMTCVRITDKFLEACDNHQMIRWNTETPIKDCLLKSGSIKHVSRLGMSKASVTDSWVHFKNETGLVLSCRKWTNEDYPDLSEILKTTGVKSVLPVGLGEAVERASVFCESDITIGSVEVKIKGSKLVLKSYGPYGDYEERTKIKYDGEPMRFRASPKLLAAIASRTKDCILTETRLKTETDKWICVVCLAKVGKDE